MERQYQAQLAALGAILVNNKTTIWMEGPLGCTSWLDQRYVLHNLFSVMGSSPLKSHCNIVLYFWLIMCIVVH